jgi:hypothetical protein
MEQMMNGYTSLVGKPDRQRPPRRLKWDDNIKTNVEEIRYDGVE